jgi:hypothetical protein
MVLQLAIFPSIDPRSMGLKWSTGDIFHRTNCRELEHPNILHKSNSHPSKLNSVIRM